MEVTLQTKIYDLLKAYPFLEEELIRLNPKYKKLKNPVLRRTVARIASIKQAAIVGGMDPVELLNFIRQKVGQPPVQIEVETEQETVPEWITKEPSVIVDGNELLDKGKNPLAEVSKLLKELKNGDTVLLLTDFRPEPLIEQMRQKRYEVFSQEAPDGRHYTYILKS